MIAELKHVFPDRSFETAIIISTMQRSIIELASYGVDQESSKNKCLENVTSEYFFLSFPLI